MLRRNSRRHRRSPRRLIGSWTGGCCSVRGHPLRGGQCHGRQLDELERLTREMAEYTDWSYYHRMDETFHQLVGTARAWTALSRSTARPSPGSMTASSLPHREAAQVQGDHIALVAVPSSAPARLRKPWRSPGRTSTPFTARCLWGWRRRSSSGQFCLIVPTPPAHYRPKCGRYTSKERIDVPRISRSPVFTGVILPKAEVVHGRLCGMNLNARGPLIESVSVTNLFGRLTYDLKVPLIDGQLSRLVLMHGDNGSGKTTLLGLVWNALSAADNKGHRSSIAKTPFESLHIAMNGGASILIEKKEGLLGSFRVTLQRPGQDDSVVNYEADDDLIVRPRGRRGRSYEDLTIDEIRALRISTSSEIARDNVWTSIISGGGARNVEAEYLQFLSEEVRNPLYLADDRSLWSDDEDILRTREIISRGQEVERRARDPLKRLVFFELQVTLRRVNDYLRSLTIGGQNDGSANSNSIYMNVLKQLATPSTEPPSEFGDTPSTAENLLREISIEAPGFEKFGLVPKFDAEEFSVLLKSIENSERRDLAERVISPFLSTMKARYEALHEAQQLLQALVPTINGFLREKTLTFSPREGLIILASDKRPLTPESLSSGERQLLMLLCTTLLARLDSRLFIIDEPELSLGVEWQRKILEALMLLTENSSVQFLIATHSIEIISSHPTALVQLKNQ